MARNGLATMRENAFKLSRLAAEFEPGLHRQYPKDERIKRILELARANSEIVLLIDELNREEADRRPPFDPLNIPGSLK